MTDTLVPDWSARREAEAVTPGDGECGRLVWSEVAIGVGIGSAVVLVAVSVTLVVRRVRRGLPAWPAAAWCCAIQLAMIFVVLEIGIQAGTLD